jgi:hypothetical protein
LGVEGPSSLRPCSVLDHPYFQHTNHTAPTAPLHQLGLWFADEKNPLWKEKKISQLGFAMSFNWSIFILNKFLFLFIFIFYFFAVSKFGKLN